jgi:glutathione S-transferase
MITIYGAYNFPPFLEGLVRHYRVVWAAEEVGLPYRMHWLDTAKGEHKEAANRAVNPFGKIPSMEDGGMKLFESGAMVNYIFEKAGRVPRDAEGRARLAQWCYAALNTVEITTLDILRYDTFWRDKPGYEWRRPESIDVGKTRMAELDAALGDKPYLLGDEFSPADILMASVIDFARTAPEIMEKAPRIVAYMKRCLARPAYLKAKDMQQQAPQLAA